MLSRLGSVLREFRELTPILLLVGGFYAYIDAQSADTDPYAPCAKHETAEAKRACKNQIDFAMGGAGW